MVKFCPGFDANSLFPFFDEQFSVSGVLALAVDLRPIKLQTPPMDLVISELDFVLVSFCCHLFIILFCLHDYFLFWGFFVNIYFASSLFVCTLPSAVIIVF